MPDDIPQPRLPLAALLRAPVSAEDAERLVALVRALAAADRAAHEQADTAPDDARDGHGRP